MSYVRCLRGLVSGVSKACKGDGGNYMILTASVPFFGEGYVFKDYVRATWRERGFIAEP